MGIHWYRISGDYRLMPASPGYKVNRAQIIGQIVIFSARNPALVDQTNREGLRDSVEKSALVSLLRHVIETEFRQFLNETDKAMPSTELFTWKGEKCRILWDVKKVVSIQYRHIGTWLAQGTGKCLDRVARLRLPYALELQRAFTADLMRVGMPVAPPIFQTVTTHTSVSRCN